jgi:membrane protein YdbS with pleckstrin-like domain
MLSAPGLPGGSYLVCHAIHANMHLRYTTVDHAMTQNTENSPSASQVLYDRHPAMFRSHPLGYLGVWLMILVPVVLLLLFRKPLLDLGQFPPIFLLGVTVLGLLILLYWFLMTRAVRLRIENDDVHLERGLLNKSHVDLSMGQIRAVRVHQDLVHRVLRVGRIEVFTTGDSPEFVVNGMPDPHSIRELVRQYSGETRTTP